MKATPLARRLLASLTALAIGTAGVLAMAAPAAATGAGHGKVKVSGSAQCIPETGEFEVTWTVKNNQNRTVTAHVVTASPPGNLTGIRYDTGWQVLADESDIVGLADGDVLDPYQTVEATQVVPADAVAARLKVAVQWHEYGWQKVFGHWKWGKITKTKSAFAKVHFGPCSPEPSVGFSHNCDGEVFVTLENKADATKHAEFTVTAEGGFDESFTVPAGESEVVTVPAGQGKITVTENGNPVEGGEYSWVDDPECHQPTVDYDITCEGLTFHLSNPAEGVERVILLTPSSGDPVSSTLAPGETAEVAFAASESGLSVAVDDGTDQFEVVWEEPENCDEEPPAGTPPPEDNGEGGGELPVTGFAAGATILGAALLLTLGAGMFLVSRRRRITFTA